MAIRKTGRPPIALQGGNRGNGVVLADPAGRPYTLPFSEFLGMVNGGRGWIPLVTGSEPPTFVTDGAGVLILVAYP